MKKNIACPHCKGKGYNTIITGKRNDYCGVANEMCPACDGTGVQLADMTNADRIRAMRDWKLAECLAKIGSDANNGVIYSDRPEEWVEWLKQPAQEDK